MPRFGLQPMLNGVVFPGFFRSLTSSEVKLCHFPSTPMGKCHGWFWQTASLQSGIAAPWRRCGTTMEVSKKPTDMWLFLYSLPPHLETRYRNRFYTPATLSYWRKFSKNHLLLVLRECEDSMRSATFQTRLEMTSTLSS